MMTAEMIAKKKEAVRNGCSQAEKIARWHVSKRPTRQLIQDFVTTNAFKDPNVSTVRGWIMDELEKRNPEAFEAWLEQDDPDDRQLSRFFAYNAFRGQDGSWYVRIGHGDTGIKVADRESAVAEIMRLALR